MLLSPAGEQGAGFAWCCCNRDLGKASEELRKSDDAC